MKITVLEITGKSCIKVNCKYGTFIGRWMEENISKTRECYIEIDYNKILNYQVLNKREYFIGNIDGKNFLCGLIVNEAVDYFPQYLDVGGDSFIEKPDVLLDNTYRDCIVGEGVIMISIEEKKLKNKFVKLEVDEIQLWPIWY